MSDYIKKLAKQSGMEWETQSWCWLANPPHLERFAELVRKDEREACAKLCEDLHNCEPELCPDDCANEIRARGNHEQD